MDNPFAMTLSTKIFVSVCLVCTVAAIAMLLDFTVPLFSFKVPLQNGFELRVMVYDHNNGALMTFLKNVKTIIENWRSLF